MKRDSTISHTGLISKDNTMVLNLVGCLMVLLSHFGSYCEIRTFAPFGAGGVFIFLVLSGYGLYLSWSTAGLEEF